MTMARTAISKRTRFEVFKRDKFACQYCGKAAPNVVLQVDHIQPCAKDGDSDILNLVTACQDCNAGKSDKVLSDDTAVQKRKQQLDDLQERREQLGMMVEWQKTLLDLDETATQEVGSLWSRLVSPYTLTSIGYERLGKLVRKYGLGEIFECMRISVDQYAERGGDSSFTHASVIKAFDYIERIARSRKKIQERPYLADLYLIRNIARSRCNYFNDWAGLALIEKAYLAGHDTDELREIALYTRRWSDWSAEMEALLAASEVTK
jgi:hypothetical protein